MSKTVADRYYNAYSALGRAENEVADVLNRAFGGFVEVEPSHYEGARWSDFSADYYDESIEVFGPSLCFSEHVKLVLAEAGFARVWLHAPECEPPRGDGCKCRSYKLR